MTTRRSRFTLIATAGSAIALATAAPPAATAANPGYVFDSPSVLEISEPDATTVTFTYRNGTTETRRSCGVTVSSAEWMTGYRDAVLDADDVAAAAAAYRAAHPAPDGSFSVNRGEIAAGGDSTMTTGYTGPRPAAARSNCLTPAGTIELEFAIPTSAFGSLDLGSLTGSLDTASAGSGSLGTGTTSGS